MNEYKRPEKKVQDKLYKYGNVIINAKIDGSAKALLWFYAFVFNWEQGQPSFWAQRKIAAVVGMSPSTYQNKRKYLEKLGWITVFNRGFDNSCLVRVKVGENDPEYETKCWAKWHPENEKKTKDAALAKFLSESTDVFGATNSTSSTIGADMELLDSKQDNNDSSVD